MPPRAERFVGIRYGRFVEISGNGAANRLGTRDLLARTELVERSDLLVREIDDRAHA